MYCQKCRSPLKLDQSLEDLNPAAFDLLVGMYSALILSNVNSDSQKEQQGQIYNTRHQLLHPPRYSVPIPEKEERYTTESPKGLSLPFSSGIYLPLIAAMEGRLQHRQKPKRILKCPL